VLTGPAEVRTADHACWVYDDDAAFAEAARQYLAEGLDRGDRLLCVGDAAALEQVRRAAGTDRRVSRDALQFVPITGAYPAGGRLVPDAQLAFYQQATRRALADGYRGLRVVAELTQLATGPGGSGDLLRWEHLADGFMAAGSGMSALCAYRRDGLPDGVLADVACAHPLVHAGPDETQFRVFFDGGGLAVGAERLSRVLAGSPVPGPAARIDLGRVEFMDAAGCRTVAAWAHALEQRAVPVTVTGASRMVRRMWQLLGFAEVTGVSFADVPG
jgi:DcmR-like sensory protein/STAS domain-containing protein